MKVALFSVFLTMVSVFAFISVQASSPPSLETPENIVEKVEKIEVAYGRTVTIDPARHLHINLRDGDFCTVVVLLTPFNNIVGSLNHNKFSCDFSFGEIKYSHFGGRSPSTDYINLQIRYSTQTNTYITPIRLVVEIIFIQRTILTNSHLLIVNELGGYSQVIDQNILGFSYNHDTEECKVAMLDGIAGLPRFGSLIDDPSQGTSLSCDRFLNAGVRYKHDGLKKSLDRDEIPAVVTLTDSSGNIFNQEYFQISVRILNGLPNTSPRMNFSSTYLMEVNQFVMTAFTSNMLQASDYETDDGDLIFNLTKPLLSHEGQLVSTDDRSSSITSFYQRDIWDYKIAYKPPSEDSNQVRTFTIEFEILDTEGMVSAPFNFLIVVNPMNTLSPVITRNTGQLLFQGQSRSLSSNNNLEISDEDNLSDVVVQVLHGPKHGHLIINNGQKIFKPSDLLEDTVIYEHDGSETYSDNIVFQMHDGDNSVEFLFPIYIAPIDTNPPLIDTNTVLVVFEHDVVLVSNYVLDAVDSFSSSQEIQFTLMKEYSNEGEFILIKIERPKTDKKTWKLRRDGFYEKVVYGWSQANIDNEELFYRYIGPHSSLPVMDIHGFFVQDGADPPNKSKMNQFVVKVLPVDIQPPTLNTNVTLMMKVREFELTLFTREILQYSDEDSNDKNILYTVTSAISELTSGSSSLHDTGRIVLYENPEEAVGSFTQAQIDHLKIAYQPPNTELGMIARMLQFTFSVSDMNGNKQEDQSFIILLNPVDNSPPSVVNRGFQVEEGGLTIVTPISLDATDEDTESQLISFTLVKEPPNGLLKYDSSPISVAGSFTRSDLENGRILYQHLGSEETSDSFGLVVSDGMHKIPITVHITVQPIDDEQPSLAQPVDGILDFSIKVYERGLAKIDSKVLRATDTDTNDLMLTFIVTKEPTKGQILLDGVSSNRFTQKDILNNLVMYAHTAGEIGTDADVDSFELTLSDLSDEWTYGGNRIERIELSVNILPVDSEQPVITMNEAFIVKEGSKATIHSSHLIASDKDTEDDKILCMITTQASEGFVENSSPAPGSELSRVGQPVSSFTIADIKAGNINYVQSVHSGSEPTEDRFAFMCQDGIPNLSLPTYFFITIEPVNDEVPRLSVASFITDEGGLLPVDLLILNGDDEDIPEDELSFTLTLLPKHGTFYKQKNQNRPIEVTEFTIEDLERSSVIYYKHDDSETTSDVFEIKLSDGEHSVKKEIPIKILPVDDETPRLSINIGLDVEINESVVIGSNVLKATDLDSDDSRLRYIIRFGPQQGVLLLIDDDGEEISLQIGDSFLQSDLDSGRLRYQHSGQVGIRDLIKFDVTDGHNPLIDRYFYISIAYMDILFPRVINKGVTIKEGGQVKLTTDILSTADINSADEELTFTIAQAPAHGHLESTDRPGLPITTFTQLELAGNKINYVHTGDDEVKMDSFEFEVTDGYNPVYRTFRISISDVDNKKPVVTISKVQVKEGSSKLITPFELKVDDRDTDDELLVIRITQIPMHGKIVKNKDKAVRKFTMVDLNENRISYKHDGSETTSDSFSLVVSDGTHDDFYVFPNTSFVTRDPQTMKIEIISVDNKIPQLVRNRAAPMLSILKDGRRGFKFTKKTLQADDSDSDSSSLTFIITKYPVHGKVTNIADNGFESLTTFTQDDINNMLIYYILDDDSDATSDSFLFVVRDSGGNELPENTFRLNWGLISFENSTYTTEEENKYLHVTLLRRGFVGETSFVTISTRDGTAISGKDFKDKLSSQVQFNPGQTKASWKVKILQDEIYEKFETFFLDLSDPVMAILEEPRTATINIIDPEDESTVFIPKKAYKIEENLGKFLVPIHRTGDLSRELMVVCYTVSNTAQGTTSSTLGSFKDFISRAKDYNSLIRFSQNESEKFCPVVIIDDSLYEPEEKFHVKLTSVMNGRLGNFSEVEVTIMPDTNDEPIFYFDKPSYEIDESAGQLEVLVWRTGTDLTQTASVTVQSRKSDPESAIVNKDYIGISETLQFAQNVDKQTLQVNILDDLGNPLLEGEETFDLLLSMPTKGILGKPDNVKVTIIDSYSDLPVFQFSEAEVEVNEADGNVSIAIIRNGDLSQPATVRCYTRQSSAQVMMDFKERPNTNQSVIHFESGHNKVNCTIQLVDDSLYEEDETFRLLLGSPLSNSATKSRLGLIREVLVTIKDNSDKPTIGFNKSVYDVMEPRSDDDRRHVHVVVTRKGDLSKQSIVRLYTKDGNAESGKDYSPLSKELLFDVDVVEKSVNIEILFDELREIRESFTIRLEPDQNLIAELENDRAIIYINQQKVLADVTFPSVPSVISLRDYDQMSSSIGEVSHGYPVICVSPCNTKHYNYQKVSSICESEGINDTATQFRWLVAAPSSDDGVTNPLKEVSQNTFFTDTNMITLDSIYFKQGSRISCVARAVNNDGEAGLESTSDPITVSKTEAVCQSRIPGSVGAEPFSAHIRYTGADDKNHQNLVKITVSMPHVDGMLPVISTRQLSNFEITLSRDGTRVGNHRCSNIVNFDELRTKSGFLSNQTRDPNIIGESFRYQYDSTLRDQKTLLFYRNLKHEACVWQFTAYYEMSELVQECGGHISTDGQVRSLVQSYVSLRVPLYVSYIYHSPVGKGWQHFDQQTELRLTFVYDTAILWDKGVGTPPESELQGNLYPTSMRIREDGRLVVNFRTKARFHGLFVSEHPGTDVKAMVMSSSHSELTMTLNLVRSADTYNNPEQKWTFVSDYAIRDYSGTYTIKLIPCTTPAHVKFTPNVVCNPRDPLSFDIDIRFQQVSDPVSVEFSLNTNFYLLSKKSLYLSDGSMGFADDSDPAFVKGAEIYGRVTVDPVQNLGNSFDISIEKVFICSGRDGYVPKYSPDLNEFGCLVDSLNLLHQFKVLDKEQPDTEVKAAQSIPFKALLALDDPEAFVLRSQPGSDGFRIDSKPLFTVDVGREWYLHVIYTVHTKDKRIRKRATKHHSIQADNLHQVYKRALDKEIGKSYNRGTQMMHIMLDNSKNTVDDQPSFKDRQAGLVLNTEARKVETNTIIPIVIGVLVFGLLTFLVFFYVFRIRKKQNNEQTEVNYSSGIPLNAVERSKTTSKVVRKKSDAYSDIDGSEV